MVDSLDVAPAFALAELLTTTDVIGSPPIKELIRLPIPCALSSRLVSVILLFTSSLSEASIHSKVSIDATIAMVAPVIHTLGFVNPEISGKVIRFLKSSKLFGTGSVTRCSGAIASVLSDILNNSLRRIPVITATKAPGSTFNFLSAGTLSQANRIEIETSVITTAPGCIADSNSVKKPLLKPLSKRDS